MMARKQDEMTYCIPSLSFRSRRPGDNEHKSLWCISRLGDEINSAEGIVKIDSRK